MAGTNIVDIAELDCIYLSYDEPKKEEFWALISSMVPWAKRVDGVKGSDAAHKAAANASETDRFILIDGDNLPDPDFFSQQLRLDDTNRNKVFRWKAKNIINGLAYGNGGLSCWTKDFILNMKTHEASEGDDRTAVEFCWDDDYWPMHDVWSTTYPNQSSLHAWRAGFREGIKMCLDRGTPVLSASDIHPGNLKNLTIWHNIGTDVENGHWALTGARQGTWSLFEGNWDYRKVHDFDALNELFNETFYKASSGTHMWDEEYFDRLGHDLKRYGFRELHNDQEWSVFFKDFAQKRENKGIMVREGF